jgi:hypothetical protein
MSSSFIFPAISSLPPGYDCTISIPTARLAAKVVRDGKIRCTMRIFHDGEVAQSQESVLSVENGKPTSDVPKFFWPDHNAEWKGGAGFLEIGFRADDGKPMFSDQRVIGFYAIYSKPGKKSFFSDNAFRYGAPPTINQIAAFGKYVDAYPVIHLDRRRDLGETVTLINPYEKPVRAKIVTHDGRELRTRVAPNSVTNLRLLELLRDDEEEWSGHLQLTATNRLVTFHIKHSLADPTVISDHEHMDPFRGDQTHFPLTQMLRLRWGLLMKKHGFIS